MALAIRTYSPFREDEPLVLSESVGWTNHTRRPALPRAAYRRSLGVFAAYDGARLAGVGRRIRRRVHPSM